MKNIHATIHYYSLDMSKPEQAAQYEALKAELEATEGRGRWLHVIAGGKDSERTGLNGSQEEIVLDTGHLFSNQWNSDKGRVFDWYEGIYPNVDIRRGHYLDITPPMVNARKARLCCGYCGGQIDTLHWPHSKIRPEFHTDCLASEYLKEENLGLLRLKTADFEGNRGELSAEELEMLKPRYEEAQTHMREARAVKIRERVIDDAERKIRNAKKQRDGMLWLLDHDINTDNCIYYDRGEGIFSFGWRTELSEGVAKELDRKLKTAHFPFEYELKINGQGTTQPRRGRA